METLREKLGINDVGENKQSPSYVGQYINLKLSAMGLNIAGCDDDRLQNRLYAITDKFISNYTARAELFPDILCPADERIQGFLTRYFADVNNVNDVNDVVLPSVSLSLDTYGIARELSVAKGDSEYKSKYLSSYRIKQGILNNPTKDKRTTEGVFHIAEGGLPIPYDKKAVPKNVAKYILSKGFSEQGEIMELPYLSRVGGANKTYVSLLIKPRICPSVKGLLEEKYMEIRLFAPGGLVSNLDFVESIFGNEGSPFQITNDSALDAEHWTGHTGCIILAPQLTNLKKKEIGLPHVSEATERQKRDGMCWESSDELYNDGKSFKLTVRTDEGVIVTLIADNYYGYSKKEVKTMMSYSANLYGNVEEEHAGGALVFPAYNQGESFQVVADKVGATIEEVIANNPSSLEVHKEGYAIDKNYPNIYYIPENAKFRIKTLSVTWMKDGEQQCIKLLPNRIYILPDGSKFRMERYSGALNYRLVQSYGEGTFCHKPCTVSGGGKSEISKSIQDAIILGSFYIQDYENDFKKVQEIIDFDYSARYNESCDSRKFLSSKRSMGSVIKLLTPSSNFTDEYNEWLAGFPQYIKGIAFVIKRFYREEWPSDWTKYFGVDILNGVDGHELKYKDRKIFARYLRVGYQSNGKWRTFKLRQDFVHADKLQMEDDITVSTVVPTNKLNKVGAASIYPSVKITTNAEYRLFQRPDDAINRGYDKKAERDLSSPNTFISNFEPLTKQDAKDMVDDVINTERYTTPMRELIEEVANDDNTKYFISSAHPRVVEGKPTPNVRYLQTTDELLDPTDKYIAEKGMRLARKLHETEPLYIPVTAVLPGRRNNPAAKGIRPLAVYNPVHYQELPELFMDFICSLTGKSPSTTGSGSEGALTKGPFNALCAVTDLNNALLSYILTDYKGFTTPAGHIGKYYRIDHDISVLIPEMWSRLLPAERDPRAMIDAKLLEKVNDFEYEGKTVAASRLGYRITADFVNKYFGRIFENPNVIFDEKMLKPELQSMAEFVDGVNNIVENQAVVATNYFKDGSVNAAVPPLKALLHIMAHGEYEGKNINSPEVRELFTRESVINSEWYKARLQAKQEADIKLWKQHEAYVINFMNEIKSLTPKREKEMKDKLTTIRKQLEYYTSPQYLHDLEGTIGKDILETVI